MGQTYCIYMKSVTITVRISKELYEKVKGTDIKISEVVREALIREVEKKKLKEIEGALDKAREAVRKMGVKNIVKDIRRMREKR